MNNTHLTYCKNAAIDLIGEIDANPSLIDEPDILLDRIESYAYSPHPHLTIEHAENRILAELIAIRPDLKFILD